MMVMMKMVMVMMEMVMEKMKEKDKENGEESVMGSPLQELQIVANSFRNSSSKNCFPSILLQFRFIYYLAVSR